MCAGFTRLDDEGAVTPMKLSGCGRLGLAMWLSGRSARREWGRSGGVYRPSGAR